MNALFDWIDQRTGAKKLLHEALFENVPGGARWRYVWGSTLLFAFAVQVITGIFLWLAYNPSSQTAWESVYYIQYEMWGGWFLRGLHHYTAQAMTVLLVFHLLQVIIDGAYKAPREVNFWSGVVLLLLVLALSLTGYLLPWDQKGYQATKVATGILSLTPFIGQDLQKLVLGAADYGHHTISRFFALHAGIIPGGIIAFIVAHLYLFRRHGVTAKQPKRRPDAPFWPDQVFRDVVACLAVLLVVIFFNLRTHGADLDAPADPSEPYPARPEWYFLFLFQILRLPMFTGHTGELMGAFVLPTLVMLILIIMPFIGRSKVGHKFNLAFMWSMLGIVVGLTVMARKQDSADASFVADVQKAKRDAERAIELAQDGIPVTGAITLLHNDPLTQGPKIFAANCASCHRYDGHDGLGNQPKDKIAASDLKGFGSREWLNGLFDPEVVAGPKRWGGTHFAKGKMVKWVNENVPDFTAEQKQTLQKAIWALSAEAKLPAQKAADARDAAAIEEGKKQINDSLLSCTDCHKFHDVDNAGDGPDLTGFASKEWLTAFVSDPSHVRFFGEKNDRMPSFGKDKTLTDQDISIVVDWLRGDWTRSEKAGEKQP